MSTLLQAQAAYNRDAVLSATPAQLVVMLYDRLVLDMKRAEAAQLEERWADASVQLLHAQDIITQLQMDLRLDVWDGAERLFAIYSYVRNALMSANVSRSVDRTRESLRLIEPLRESWHAAAESLVAADASSGAGARGVA